MPRRLLCLAGSIALVAATGACNAILGIESVDPAPVPMTLSQTTSSRVTHGLACGTGGTTNFTLENSFYRRFRLADHGARNEFVVKGVSFGVYRAVSNQVNKLQPLKIFIYEDTSPDSAEVAQIDTNRLVKHGDATVGIPDTMQGGVANYEFDPVVVVPSGVLVVELRVEGTAAQMRTLLLGANQESQSASSYQRAPACGRPEPVPLETEPSFAGIAVVLTVTGEG